MLCPWHFFDFI